MHALQQQDMTRLFRALSVEKRVEIVQLLAERTLCVGALSRLLRISAGAASQHLRILRDAGLVKADRHGYFVHYSLAADTADRCRVVIDTLFAAKSGPKKERRGFVGGKQSAKGRKN